jgi:hypothetical protein
MKKLIRTALVIGVLSASPLGVANTFCATDAQRTAIQAAMADPAKPAPYRVAAKLSVPEATVQSALSPASYGIHASQFRSVWTSLTNWEEAVTVVMKGGHIFETHGRIPEGEPSKRSQFFNLKSKTEGMHGHLRPDLLSAIYVMELPIGDETQRGVLFYDMQGDIAFGVYLPGEGHTPSAAALRQFAATRDLIQQQPSVCR